MVQVAAVTLAALPLLAQVPQVEENVGWQQTLRAKGWDEADVAQLERDKLIVTRETCRQVFSPYIGSELPVFVTADAPLNAFHVLLQESLVAVERSHSLQLSGLLQALWSRLGQELLDEVAQHPLAPAALRRVRIVLAVAMDLLGDRPTDLDARLAAAVTREVERVEAAEDVLLPDWFGPADASVSTLDYSRFSPRGFYTQEPGLARFFRACSWLQAIPFRVSQDDELLGMVLLGRALDVWREGRRDRSCEAYRQGERGQEVTWFDWLWARHALYGGGDSWDLLLAEKLSGPSRKGLAGVRRYLLEWVQERGRPVVDDQLHVATSESEFAGLTLRVVASSILPDAVLFQHTMKERRDLPSGLEVAAALGSEDAVSWLASERDLVLEAVRRTRTLFEETDGLYGHHLFVLKSLVDGPDPDAPELFRDMPWRRRSVGAALAGWAQMRHALLLPAKESALYGGAAFTPAGYVEPNPEFFARLADLAASTGRAFSGSHSLVIEPRWLAAELGSRVESVEARLRNGEPEFLALESLRSLLDVLGRLERRCVTLAEYQAGAEVERFAAPEILAAARKLAEDLESGRLGAQAGLAEVLTGRRLILDDAWSRLTVLCRRLEALAHKQLRGRPLSASDETFLREFGEELAGIMLYGGNAYLTPHDDAPRIASVATVWWGGSDLQHLHAAVGRPRALYLLYPDGGREVLCRGGVMPYFELATEERLTDEEWKQRLDTAPAPEPPEWLASIMGRFGDGRPGER